MLADNVRYVPRPLPCYKLKKKKRGTCIDVSSAFDSPLAYYMGAVQLGNFCSITPEAPEPSKARKNDSG
jgi:hypothetical protein